jgi:hypothetical protein
MICEKCGNETESITCSQCGGVIQKLGPFCYLCGQKCVEAEKAIPREEAGDTIDFTERVLCSDGACIGVIDEKGICKECGKPYTPES